MATKYVMYSESPDGSNMVSTPTDKTIYTGIAYMPDEIKNNPNLISSSTTYQNRTVNGWDWVGIHYNLNDMGIRPDDKITILSTVKIPSGAPKGISLNARFHASDTVYTDRPSSIADRGLVSPGEEKEVYTVTTVPSLVSTSGLPPVTVRIRYSRIDSDGTGDSFVTQGKCDGIFLGDTIKTWKPSPTDWLADKSNYTWTQTKYVMYSKNPDGSGMTPIQTPETIYRGIAYLPDSILTNPNLLNKITNPDLAPIIGENRNNQSTARWNVDKGKITVGKRYYFTVKYNVNATAENPSNSRLMMQTGDDYSTNFPTVSPVVSGNNLTMTGENVWNNGTIALLKTLYFRLDYVLPTTTITPISAILCETQNAEWKPSPQDWSADPSNYVWSQMIYTMYSASPDGSNMVETPTAQTIYRGLAYMPESISSNPNLYDGTKDFTGDKWINKGSWTFTPNSYLGLSTARKTILYGGLCQQIQAKAGEKYTYSGYVKTDRISNVGIFAIAGGANNNTVSPFSKVFTLPVDEWTRISFTFDVLQDVTLRTAIEKNVSEGYYEVAGLKMEKGSTATPYTPSPSDWLSDKSNYTWTTRGTTATRYSVTIDGSNMTTDKRPESKYVGLVSVSEDLYFRQNLLRDSAYYDNKSPTFNALGTTSTHETVVLDGFKCTKVTMQSTPSPGNKGVYIQNNDSRLYSVLQPYDVVVVSFMIKGSVRWSPNSPALERSTLLSLTNKKNSYPDWERVVWIGTKNEVAGAFNFYSDDTQAYTFYLRDICIQKADAFTGYKIAPQEFVLNPYNYNWEPIEKTVIKYSDNYDGLGMTSEKGINSRFMGIANIPAELYKNANLLKNPDFSHGTNDWSGSNNSILNLLTAMPNGLPLPEPGVRVISNTNITANPGHVTQQFEKLPPGTYTLSSNVFAAAGYGNAIGINKWRFPQGGQFIDNELKSTNEKGKWIKLTLGITITFEDRYVFSIVGGSRPDNNNTIGTIYSWHPKLEKGLVATEWTPSIEDWLSDPKNYIWISLDNRVTRYSPSSNGSNMTVDRQTDSLYRGVGYIPLDLYVNENILKGTKGFASSNWNRGADNTIEDKGNYSIISLNLLADQQVNALGYTDLLRQFNIALKPNTTYTFSFYEEEASGDYSTYIFSDVSTDGNVMTSEGIKTIFSDTRINWTQRGNGIRKWVTFKTKSDINTSPSKNVLFRYFYKNPKTDFNLKVSRVSLVEGSEVTAWHISPQDWLGYAGNYTWTELTDVLKPEHVDNVDSMFPLTNLKLSNGIYYHMNVTRETSFPYSRDIPGWTYYTILDCRFNNTLNAGNTNILLSQLEGLVIKRRKKGTFNWITLKEIPVNSPADLNVVYQDSFLPSGSEFQYALVPILTGNIEGEYVMNEVFSSFNGVFISDNTTIFKLFNAVVYGATTANTSKGMIQPIGSRYPIIVNNSDVNYRSGQISSLLMGYKFEKTREIDRLDVVNQTSNLNDYLNTNGAKVITDWNGNIFVCRISSSPTTSYNSAYGNGINTVSFDWVEQAQYDNQEEMYESGLLDTRG